MMKGLLRCLSESLGIPFCSFNFKHFDTEGTCQVSHTWMNPPECKRKILTNEIINCLKNDSFLVSLALDPTNRNGVAYKVNNYSNVNLPNTHCLCIWTVFFLNNVKQGEFQKVSFVLVQWHVPELLRSAVIKLFTKLVG